MGTLFEKKLNEIRRGVYSFDEIGDIATKKQMAEVLVKEYEDKIITPEALSSLVSYYADQIKLFKRIKIDDVPESLRELVSEKL